MMLRDSKDFAVGQVWRTHGGGVRLITYLNPESALPIESRPIENVETSVVDRRYHDAHGGHRTVRALDLIECLAPDMDHYDPLEIENRQYGTTNSDRVDLGTKLFWTVIVISLICLWLSGKPVF